LAAGLAIDDHKTVQDISYAKLRQRLLATGQKLVWTSPPKPAATPASEKPAPVPASASAKPPLP